MSLILLLIFTIALLFGKWVGIPISWLLTKMVANPYGAIVIAFLLIISLIRILNIFTGETRIVGLSFPRFRRGYKTKKIKSKDV